MDDKAEAWEESPAKISSQRSAHMSRQESCSGEESSLAGSEHEQNDSDEEVCREERAEQVHQLGAGHKRSMKELRPKKFVFKSGYLAKKRDQLKRQSNSKD